MSNIKNSLKKISDCFEKEQEGSLSFNDCVEGILLDLKNGKISKQKANAEIREEYFSSCGLWPSSVFEERVSEILNEVF